MTNWNINSFEEAVKQAQISFNEGGIPIGSALDKNKELIAVGHNERVQKNDPIAHGEMSCLRNAGRLKSYKNTVLYTTLSPCQMCSGAILLFKIPLVVVGESETFKGNLDYLIENGVEIVEVNDLRCINLMKKFQQMYPTVWAEDIGS